MKQLIVMVATVMLGISIGVMVMSFTTQAESVSGTVGSKVDDIISVYETTGETEYGAFYG